MSSRIEIFFKAIKEGTANNLPTPQSRLEKLLYAIATGNDSDIEAPASRVEEALYYILKNGGIGGGNNGSNDWIFHNIEIKDILKIEDATINSLTLNDIVNIELVEV